MTLRIPGLNHRLCEGPSGSCTGSVSAGLTPKPLSGQSGSPQSPVQPFALDWLLQARIPLATLPDDLFPRETGYPSCPFIAARFSPEPLPIRYQRILLAEDKATRGDSGEPRVGSGSLRWSSCSCFTHVLCQGGWGLSAALSFTCCQVYTGLVWSFPCGLRSDPGGPTEQQCTQCSPAIGRTGMCPR